MDPVLGFSPANLTDLVYYGHVGEIIDRGDYVVVRTPSEPTSYLGNQIIVRSDVDPDDVAQYVAAFRDEFCAFPDVRHITLNLQGEVDPACARSAFDHQLRLVENDVLSVAEPFPAPMERSDIDVRAIDDDEAWNFVIEGQLEKFDANPTARAYYERHFQTQRDLVRAGSASWLCAVIHSERAASLGVLRHEALVRFQAIRTDPRFRRRGIASHLMTIALALVRIAFAATRAIVVTHQEFRPALSLYEKLGFEPAGKQVFLGTW